MSFINYPMGFHRSLCLYLQGNIMYWTMTLLLSYYLCIIRCLFLKTSKNINDCSDTKTRKQVKVKLTSVWCYMRDMVLECSIAPHYLLSF